ncbi:MAG TPA: hypothetical protein VFO25_00285 [Candidatus Eremiobacteraceae bacterium]|nr:hypothetical protein [Candidatus Eremiobacteraceae bacterium]
MRIGFAVVAVLGLGLMGSRPLAADITGTSSTGTVVVQLDQMSSSGQTGTATLTSTIDNKTQVTIQLTGEPPNAQEPAHIHTGKCKKLNPKPAYLLTNVVGGTSTTTVNASLTSLEAGRFSVNVHESTQNFGTYVACGTIPAGSQAPPAGGATPTPAPMSTYRPRW